VFVTQQIRYHFVFPENAVWSCHGIAANCSLVQQH